jgi:GTP-binding protein
MLIKSAEFVKSSQRSQDCPEGNYPEYAFIGRSNVGKSSLLNMLSGRKSLARISVTPGKTQLINHFLINNEWYLVDLPGVGFAKISKTEKKKWGSMITSYLMRRKNIAMLFLLVDSRLEPQAIDMEVMEAVNSTDIPFVLVFTKIDKLTRNQLAKNLATYKRTLLKHWDELPPIYLTSSSEKKGREEILELIERSNADFLKTR